MAEVTREYTRQGRKQNLDFSSETPGLKTRHPPVARSNGGPSSRTRTIRTAGIGLNRTKSVQKVAIMSITKLKTQLQAALDRNDNNHAAKEVRDAKKALRAARNAREGRSGGR